MPNYEKARAAVRQLAREQSKVDKVEAALTFADIIGGAVDSAQNLSGLASFSGLSGAASLLRSFASVDDIATVLPNLNFTMNGHDDADSPITVEYFRGRSLKNLGGSALSLVGVAASAGTAGVNVASAIQHGNATGSTLVHLLKLGAMANRERKMERVTIADWLKVLIAVKSMKAAVRGASLAGAVIPAASLGVGIGTAIAKLGIKITMTKVCYATAAQLHWRAFQEQAISGGLGKGTGGKIGPASEIVWEIFKKRGLTRVFGQYDVAKLVREPAGWLPLADKITLI